MEAHEGEGRIDARRRDRLVAVGVAAAAAIASATLLNPTLFGRSPASFDLSLGVVELFVFPTSLVAATLMIAFGGRATTVAGAAVLAAAGLTVCQPFGATVGGEVSSTDLNGSTVIAEGEQVALRSAFPPLRIVAYGVDTRSLSESSPGSSDAKARTWIVPGLLSHAATLSYYDHFDTVRLRRLSDGGLAMELLPGDPTKVRARHLSYGIASWLGAGYWLATIAIVSFGVRRRRRPRHGDDSVQASDAAIT